MVTQDFQLSYIYSLFPVANGRVFLNVLYVCVFVCTLIRLLPFLAETLPNNAIHEPTSFFFPPIQPTLLKKFVRPKQTERQST